MGKIRPTSSPPRRSCTPRAKEKKPRLKSLPRASAAPLSISCAGPSMSPCGDTACKAFGQGDGFEHGFGFVDRLLIFGFRSGIVDPAPAGLDVSPAVFEQSG